MTITAADRSQQPESVRSLVRAASVRKLLILGTLAIATLIPTTLISGLVSDREGFEEEARAAVARSFGPEQTVRGPTIMIPLRQSDKSTIYARVEPKMLDITATLVPEQRRRGFFTTTVYAATLHMKGTFTVPETMRGSDGTIVNLPTAAFLAVTLDRASGVDSSDKASVAGQATSWQPFEDTACGGGQVLVVPVDLAASRDNLPIEADLHLRGSRSLRFAAAAKRATVSIAGAWPTPSFVGDEPPLRSTVKSEGFDAKWRTDGLGEPRLSLATCAVDLSPAAVGVDLIRAVPVYRMVMRVAKYGLLFVVLAFTAYFVFETITGVAIGVLQYALLAGSLSLFALLLVSIAEFTGYTAGYVIGAILVIGQASLYTASVLRRRQPALGFAALLAGLFGFLYVLLGLESYALVIGTVALFVVLSIVMAVTQSIQPVVAP